MNKHSCDKALVWLLCVGIWLTIPAVAEAGTTKCTTKIPLCRNLAPYFVDVKKPLEHLSIKDRQHLSKNYDLILVEYKKTGVRFEVVKLGYFIIHSTTDSHYLTVAVLSGSVWELTRISKNSIELTVHGDHGHLDKKVKYFFDLPSQTVFPPKEFKAVNVHRANV